MSDFAFNIPPEAISVPAVTAPHFDLPFKFGAVVEQGMGKDLQNCVYAVCLCPLGWREEVPEFGIPDLTFENLPAMKSVIKTSIQSQEPRADIFFTERQGLGVLNRLITAAVETRTVF